MRRLIVIACLLLLAGCGGGTDPAAAPKSSVTKPTAPKLPARAVLRIVIDDPIPLDIYFNEDDHVCTSQNFADTFNLTLTPRVQVVVRDSTGRIVGTKTAPSLGGTNSKRGCVVPVSMLVPYDAFYEVTVTGGNDQVSRSATVRARPTASYQEVTLEF